MEAAEEIGEASPAGHPEGVSAGGFEEAAAMSHEAEEILGNVQEVETPSHNGRVEMSDDVSGDSGMEGSDDDSSDREEDI